MEYLSLTQSILIVSSLGVSIIYFVCPSVFCTSICLQLEQKLSYSGLTIVQEFVCHCNYIALLFYNSDCLYVCLLYEICWREYHKRETLLLITHTKLRKIVIVVMYSCYKASCSCFKHLCLYICLSVYLLCVCLSVGMFKVSNKNLTTLLFPSLKLSFFLLYFQGHF